MVPHQPKPTVLLLKICATACGVPVARCLPAKFTDCRQSKAFMDHLPHIHHQGLDTNPQRAINLLCGIFWSPSLCKCQPAEEVWPVVAVLNIRSAEDGYKGDHVDLCDSPWVCFRVIGLCAFPPSRRARLLIGLLVATTLTIRQDIVHMCARACVCASDLISHRRLPLSPSFTPSVHGNSRQPQISFSCCNCCSCVCVKSNHWNLSEPNSVQMYRAASDNTLPWNLCADWTGKHTIACAHPRACGPSFLSPTKGSASVFHGARQTLFDNLFIGWNKKTTCAWRDDRDLMFVEGEERERERGGEKQKVSRHWRSQNNWRIERIKSKCCLRSVYYT